MPELFIPATAEAGAKVRKKFPIMFTIKFTIMEWKTAVFYIRNPSIANAQNGGADFRFVVSPPEIYVRAVIVSRNPK